MKAKKDVSNRAIFALIIAVAIVTIISTYFIVDTALSVEVLEEPASQSGEASLKIMEEPASMEPETTNAKASLEITSEEE